MHALSFSELGITPFHMRQPPNRTMRYPKMARHFPQRDAIVYHRPRLFRLSISEFAWPLLHCARDFALHQSPDGPIRDAQSLCDNLQTQPSWHYSIFNLMSK
jgi:hypothetical protein